jgi:hypothetical protein
MIKRHLIPVAIAALLLSGCQGIGGGADREEVAGIYYLVKIDESSVPASVSHDGTLLHVSSGVIIISDNGTCFSRTRFTPPDGDETTREVYAKYRVDDSRLIMHWEGAGTTEGKVDGDTFVMDNHGTIFEYAK